MATKLYFHNASNALSGSFPSGEQSSRTPTWSATGATTLRTMNTSIGTGQQSLAGSSVATISTQDAFMGFFCSETLSGPQTVGGGTLILNAAEEESNGNANFWIDAINIYVWRPSNGTKVGTVVDAIDLGGAELSAGENVTHITGITTSSVSAADQDVIICEIWANHANNMNTSYTCTFYFDGTTENTTENAVVSNHASFVEFTETLSFGGSPPAGSDRVAASGRTAISGRAAASGRTAISGRT